LPAGLAQYLRAATSNNTPQVKHLAPYLYQAKQMIWRDESESRDSRTAFNFAVVAKGEKSAKFYSKMLLTTSVLLRLIQENADELSVLFKDSPDMDYARKSIPMFDVSGGLAFKNQVELMALEEGVLSLQQLLNILTSHGIKGLHDDKMMEKILLPHESGGPSLASIVTRMYSMGTVGPTTLRGQLFDRPLVYRNGRLFPTPNYKDYLKDVKNETVPSVNSSEAERYVTCRGCPMTTHLKGEKQNAIDVLAELYWEVYSSIDYVPELADLPEI